MDIGKPLRELDVIPQERPLTQPVAPEPKRVPERKPVEEPVPTHALAFNKAIARELLERLANA